VTVGSLEFAFCVAPAHPLTHPGRPAASRMSWSAARLSSGSPASWYRRCCRGRPFW